MIGYREELYEAPVNRLGDLQFVHLATVHRTISDIQYFTPSLLKIILLLSPSNVPGWVLPLHDYSALRTVAFLRQGHRYCWKTCNIQRSISIDVNWRASGFAF